MPIILFNLLTDAEQVTLAEITHRPGRKAIEDVAKAAKPEVGTGGS